MAITLNKSSSLSDTQQWVNITVVVDGDTCKFNHVATSSLSGSGLQGYVDGREDFYKTEVLRNMYEGADCYNSTLDDWKTWITGSYTNTDETVIQKKVWVDQDLQEDPATLIVQLQAKVTALENA